MFKWGELGPDPDLRQECRKPAAMHRRPVKRLPVTPVSSALQDFVINTDVIVLSTPEIAGLPYVISGLVAAGGLAAALSTADGLLLAIANALSHDVYYKMINPNAPTVTASDVVPACLLVVASRLRRRRRQQPDRRTFWPWSAGRSRSPWRATSRHSCTGIWWKRATTAGAIAGIIGGFGIAMFYLVATRYFPGYGVAYFGMWSLPNPATGAPLVDLAKAMARSECDGDLGGRQPSHGQPRRLVRTSTTSLRD